MNPFVFNPTLEYDSLPNATFSNLGYHNSNCTNVNTNNNVCDSSLTSPGWYPNNIINLSNSYVGQSYNQVLQFVVPLDTLLSNVYNLY